MKTCRRLLFLLFLALAQQSAAAQVTLSASTLTATIAEHVELRLIVRSLENIDGMNVSLPAGDFEIIGRQNSPLIRTAEWRTLEQVITIAFFKTGDFVVGPLEEQSGAITIKIHSLLGATDKDIKPLKNLLAVTGNPLHLLKYCAVIALLLLLGAVLLLLKRKRETKSLHASTSLPEPEIELEINIRELWQKKLVQKGESKQFFIRLGEIIKHFLARMYSFNADDLTSTEIGDRLKSSEKDSAIVLCLDAVFRQADLVKFAEQIPETTAIDTLAEKIAVLIGIYKKRRSLELEVNPVQTGR
jgi:hypothetical protein